MSSIVEDIRAVMHEQAALLADMKVQIKQLKSKLETAQKELQKQENDKSQRDTKWHL